MYSIALSSKINVNKYCAKKHLLCKINNIMASYSINYIPGIQSCGVLLRFGHLKTLYPNTHNYTVII